MLVGMKRSLFQISVMGLMLLVASVSRAQLTDTDLEVLAARIKATDYLNPVGLNELPCGSYRPSKPIQVFAFDGSMGFCPRYFFMNQADEGRTNDGRSWLDRVRKTPRTSANEKSFLEIDQLLKDEKQFHNCHLAEALLADPAGRKREISSSIELHYFSKSGENAAARCLRDLQTEAKGQITIHVLGYSMGSDSALQFVKANPEVEVEHFLSVDPVGKGARWATGVLVTWDQEFFWRPLQVARWDNFFQKVDTQSISRSDSVRLGIRGSRVFGADTNTELFAADFKFQSVDDFEHAKMLQTLPVQRAIADFVR